LRSPLSSLALPAFGGSDEQVPSLEANRGGIVSESVLIDWNSPRSPVPTAGCVIVPECPTCAEAKTVAPSLGADSAWDHHFICVACGGRWTLRAHYALTA